MLKESPGQLNFTHFLTLFGEKMHGKNPSYSFSFLLTIYHTHSFMNSPSLSLLSLSLILLSAFLSILEAIIFRRSRTYKRAVLRHHVGMATRYLTVCYISSFWSITKDKWLMCDLFALFFNPAWFWLGRVILGRDPDPKMLDDMLGEAPGPLNFTMFLTLFGEKTKGMSRDWQRITSGSKA